MLNGQNMEIKTGYFNFGDLNQPLTTHLLLSVLHVP